MRFPAPSIALAVALAAAASVVGCPSATRSDARLEASDGGGVVVAYAGKTAPIPLNDLGHGGPRVRVARDEQGERLAYPVRSGGSRIVYVIGDALFLGPTSSAVHGGGTSDFSSAPPLDDALGTIFELAEGRRALAVSEVKKERGDTAVAKMLGAAAHVQDPVWDDAYATLPDPARADVRAQLAHALEPGAPVTGVARAVRTTPLDDKSRAGKYAARVRELLDPIREPAAAAVLVRAIAKLDPGEGASVGCDVLHRKPITKDAPDVLAREVLVEAAAVAVARGKAECAAIDVALGESWCSPWFRCANGKPLTGGETTKQDEPLCTTAELGAVIDRELERKPEDVMAGSSGTRASLFAYAALTAKNKVPAAFLAAHDRRRYMLTQPKEPPCDSALAPGTACHCEEAVVRDAACRHRESSTVSVGVCKFDVDAKTHKIANVVTTLPP